MANKNSHWYTDKNGNHYFVEDGQTPQEGWEASKRRKMIDGGKYKVSEDGNDWRDVEKDEYDKFESDDASFDDNVDDDFGFDEEYDANPEVAKVFDNSISFEQTKERLEELGIKVPEEVGYLDYDNGVIYGYTEDGSKELWSFNTADNSEYFEEMQKAQEENAKKGLDLQDAINMADDDVLDEQFGKDTPERKLVGAMKGQPYKSKDEPENIGDKVGKVGDKELKLSEIAEKITKYGDTDLQGLMIPILASAYGLSEAEVDKYLTDTYFANHDHNGNTKAMNKPVNKPYSMSGMPAHHKEGNHIVIDEGPFKGDRYENEEDFWNANKEGNNQVIYKDWKDMTPEEQKTTKMQAKNVFDYLQERKYNENIKDNESLEPKINALKGFLEGKKLSDEEFEYVIGLLERYVK